MEIKFVNGVVWKTTGTEIKTPITGSSDEYLYFQYYDEEKEFSVKDFDALLSSNVIQRMSGSWVVLTGNVPLFGEENR